MLRAQQGVEGVWFERLPRWAFILPALAPLPLQYVNWCGEGERQIDETGAWRFVSHFFLAKRPGVGTDSWMASSVVFYHTLHVDWSCSPEADEYEEQESSLFRSKGKRPVRICRSILALLSTFQKMWILKQEYDQSASCVIHILQVKWLNMQSKVSSKIQLKEMNEPLKNSQCPV